MATTTGDVRVDGVILPCCNYRLNRVQYSPVMPSQALVRWHGARRNRIQELYDAHRAVGGVGPGRRKATEQLNWALALRLAGEFQGFARDLHDEATIFLSRTAVTPELQTVMQATFTIGRKLDQGNAHPSFLQQDFTKLGIQIVDHVKNTSSLGAARLTALKDLNDARNAIAHSQPAKLAPLLGGTTTLRLKQIHRWDSALRGLATTMDTVVSAQLGMLSRGAKPW